MPETLHDTPCAIIALPAFHDNYIWLLRRGSAAAVIDPGDAAPVLDYLSQEQLRLADILITHHHADHQGGITGLLAHFPAAVHGPAAESITGLTQALRGGETLTLGALALRLRVLPVPGHTRGHLAYYGAGALFCGDTLFGAGCGRLFEGSAAQMFASLATLAALPEETAVYCAHEYTEANLRFALAVEPENPAVQARARDAARRRAAGLPTVPSTIRLEKATNPFLRCTVPEVIAAARQKAAGADSAPQVFAALREWRNVFQG